MKSYKTVSDAKDAIVQDGAASRLLPIEGRKPVRFIANDYIWSTYEDQVFEQAVNGAEAPGTEQVMVLPDSHVGFGVPVGSVMITDGMIYPAVVGSDICCSMSYLQTDVPDETLNDKRVRRQILDAIGQRIPTGTHSRRAPKARVLDLDVVARIVGYGVDSEMTDRGIYYLGIPAAWVNRVETPQFGPTTEWHKDMSHRLAQLQADDKPVYEKMLQLGSLGSGNHFSELQSAEVAPGMESLAARWGIQTGRAGFLTHCGSRGFGYRLSSFHFKSLARHFERWGISLPGGEKELVYAPADSQEGIAYLTDMYLASNFATLNHLLINAYLLEAVQEVIPGAKGDLVYHISHNIGHQEIVNGHSRWVFRKGSTRALPAQHHSLKNTEFYNTGHPILLPGNPEAGSYIMVGQPDASKTAYSINHGAGRQMGRKHAKRTLNQATVDAGMNAADILYNGRSYPLDEAPAAYKDFAQVTASVEQAGLAKVVAKLKARFVVKDNDMDPEGAA